MTQREIFEDLLLSSAAAGGESGGAITERRSVPVDENCAINFPPVFVSPDRIMRTTVGLRPFRPSGFVVRAEKLHETLLVHNYGHGGAGMTLSWGTAELAADLAMTSGERQMAVIGAGGVGLATARLLQQRGVQVTIYAKALPPDTTSNLSGAQWWPMSVFDRDRLTPKFREQFLRSARLSFQYYQGLVGAAYGVRWIRNYILSEKPALQVAGEDEFRPRMQGLEPGDHPFPAKHLQRIDTMMIDPAIYLRRLLDDVQRDAAKIIVRELTSKSEIESIPERVAVNCSGLGARELAGDPELIPVKGQLTILPPQPEVDYSLHFGRYYMFPRQDGILLGGTFERGQFDLAPNSELERDVLTAHQLIFEPAVRCYNVASNLHVGKPYGAQHTKSGS